MNEPGRTAYQLIKRAGDGEDTARRELLELYRDHLRRMVAARLDSRLAARVDASDVVQDTLADAANQLDDYLREQPLPFLPWLRQLAGVRIRKMHRRHLIAQSRSVARETPLAAMCEESAEELASLLVARDTSPSNRVMRQEECDAVMEAVAALPDRDKELLLMRHIEKLSMAEIAETLGMVEVAVRARHFRALTRLRLKLEGYAQQ